MHIPIDPIYRRRNPGDEDRDSEQERALCIGPLDLIHTIRSSRQEARGFEARGFRCSRGVNSVCA